MGLDIYIGTDKEVRNPDYYNEENDYRNKHNLSRTFCNFMCRRNVVSHEPELDQIGKITGVDISPIYQMETYPQYEELEFLPEIEESEAARQSMLKKVDEDKASLHGNIEKVLKTVSDLIDKLNPIDNLPDLLLPTEFDTLDSKDYFLVLPVPREGYMGDNFRQDLLNFKRFLEFAAERGTTTVWFTYG